MRAVKSKLMIVIPDTGLFEEPTIPARYPAIALPKKPSISIITAITMAIPML